VSDDPAEPGEHPEPSHALAVSTVPSAARPYQGQRAGIVTRVAANLIDVVVVIIVLAAGYATWTGWQFLYDPRSFSFPSPPTLVTVILIALWIQGVYFALAWATTGRTYGDHVMGLRVVNIKGRRMRIWGACVRAAACVLLPIGLFWIVVSRSNRSIQDVALRSSVIYDWTARGAGR